MLTAALPFTPSVVGAAVPATNHFADGDDSRAVDAGANLYMLNCAVCHGRRLQGQALWQLLDRYAGQRAPAHDASGHTWQHSDEALFLKTKMGRFPDEPGHRRSSMPAFAGKLSDRQILDVIAFIKSRWPLGLRVSQSMLNPGFQGMPKDADSVEWRLPPTCTAISRQIQAAAANQ
jgi:mono/diheme cytochrome c family protein